MPHRTQYFESAACCRAGRASRGSSTPKLRRATSAGEVADLGIVGVHDELGLREGCDSVPPAGGEELELAVAVELVAEEVPEQQRPRPDPPRDLRERRLVDLEQPELGTVGMEEGGGDPGDEIRAGAVVRDSEAWLEDRRHHRGGRRLAVRRRDERRALLEPRREPVDRARVQLPEQLAGQGRTAAAAREPRERTRAAEDGRFERQRNGRTHRGRTVAAAGPEPIPEATTD